MPKIKSPLEALLQTSRPTLFITILCRDTVLGNPTPVQDPNVLGAVQTLKKDRPKAYGTQMNPVVIVHNVLGVWETVI